LETAYRFSIGRSVDFCGCVGFSIGKSVDFRGCIGYMNKVSTAIAKFLYGWETAYRFSIGRSVDFCGCFGFSVCKSVGFRGCIGYMKKVSTAIAKFLYGWETAYRFSVCESVDFRICIGYLHIHTAKKKCRKLEANIPRKGISGPLSQFPQSYVCERIIYSHDGAAVSARGICGPILGIYKSLTDT
jgi:hypothetical protein